MKQMRKEVADLLRSGKEENARIRVEAVIREINLLQVESTTALLRSQWRYCLNSKLFCIVLLILEQTRSCCTWLKQLLSSPCPGIRGPGDFLGALDCKTAADREQQGHPQWHVWMPCQPCLFSFKNSGQFFQRASWKLEAGSCSRLWFQDLL